MSAARKTRATPAPQLRIEGSAEYISALNAAVVYALCTQQSEVSKDRRQVDHFTRELEKEPGMVSKEHTTQMLAQWREHLKHDEAKLIEINMAFQFLTQAQIVRHGERS